MTFTPESIALALFTGLIAGLSSYFGSYVKVKAELRAATEDLSKTIANLTATTRAVELEKAKIAADSTLDSERRMAVYSLASAMQTLNHSMCYLSWDAVARRSVRQLSADQYETEARKILPEIFSQLAVLRLLDQDLHARAYPYAAHMAALDVKFGEAIVLAVSDVDSAVRSLDDLFKQVNHLQTDIDSLFGGRLQLLRESRK